MRIELLDKGRAWLRWFLREQRNRRESAAFYRKHGPIVKVEPNTPENRKEG